MMAHHGPIGFSRGQCFWRGIWVFRSFPLCSCGVGYCQSRMILSGNLDFGDFLSSFFHWSRISSFPFSLPFDLWSGILPFLSFVLFSIFIFLFFFLSISSFNFPSPSLSLGYRVLTSHSLSLEEISLSFASGERRRILLIGQGSKRSKVVSQWDLLSWEPQSWYLGRDKFGCQGVALGPNFRIIP